MVLPHGYGFETFGHYYVRVLVENQSLVITVITDTQPLVTGEH